MNASPVPCSRAPARVRPPGGRQTNGEPGGAISDREHQRDTSSSTATGRREAGDEGLPARSICDKIQGPKMSPLGFASRGIVTVRR